MKEGQPENIVKYIIVDPGGRNMEGLNPGLFYTALSRATTIGNEDGIGSAIYFFGPNLTEPCIFDIGLKTTGEEYELVKRRFNWTQRLKKNTLKTDMTKKEKQRIKKFSKATKINEDELYGILLRNEWRDQSQKLNY